MASEASRSLRFRSLPPKDEADLHGAASARIVAISIDSFADASLSRERDEAGRRDLRCDACDVKIEGEPAGRGMFLWARGDEVRIDEPALCGACATAIGVRAGEGAEIEEEEG